MLQERTAGIGVMGDMPWGTHFCYFFETKQDLIETSIPFFQAGLENHEYCLWIVCAPLTEADAVTALRQSIPGMDRLLAEGAMEILVHAFSPDDIGTARSRVSNLHAKLAGALAEGYAGMRVAGSPACMQKTDAGIFREFEGELGRAVENRRMIALCQFPLTESSAAEILDAARTHQFVVSRRHGAWDIIETPEIKLTKAEIARLNEQLERRVQDRARELEEANRELRKEIACREKVEEDLRRQKEILQTIFDHLPAMLCFIGADNRIKLVNREWEQTLGWRLEDIPNQDLNFLLAENYPDPEYRRKVLEFAGNSNGEWVDLKTAIRAGRVIDTSWAILHLSDGTTVGIGQDITERKRAERELRQQKEILQTIFDHIPIMISFMDGNDRFKLVNGEWERTLGRTLQEIQSQNIDIVAENYPDPEYRQNIEHHYRDSHGEWADFKTRVADGRVIDVSWSVCHLSDGMSLCFGQDITKRKRAEEAQRESEERFREVAENIRDVFWIKTPDFKRVIYYSPRYESLSGRPREAAYQEDHCQYLLNRIVPEDRQRIAQFLERGVEAEFEIEYRVIPEDGKVHWLCDRGFPVRNQSGQIYRAAGVVQDITERKLAEALRESEARFRQLTENIHEVFWLRSPDFQQLLYVSPQYERVYGKRRDSPSGEDVLDAVHPDDRSRVRETLRGSAGRGFEIEYRINAPGGEVRWVRDRGFPIRNQNGEIYRIGGVAEDITDRKRAEDSLKASSEQLRALSAGLQSAREKEAMRIAHQIHDELGGTLTGLRWELESLEKISHEPPDQACLKAMRDKLAAMIGLTDSTINAVRRIASELRPSILDDLGLAEAVEWQVEQFQARTGIQCRCHCALQGVVLGDLPSTAIFRIVQEALTNIIRHARASRVEISMTLDDGSLLLTVIDNGRGIRLEEKAGRQSLGLLGMQERAHLIGGTLEITSGEIASGKETGTTLRVRVPLTPEASAGAA